jgi:putative two-component system response regulator
MEKNPLSDTSNDSVQLRKYAQDLAEIYRSEKEKMRELEAANQQLMRYADDFNKTLLELRTTHKELQEAYLDTIYRLALAAEYKDEETGNHIVRMSRYCSLIAEKMDLSSRDIENIRYASPMHDIGKIGIPDSILLKPGKLTPEEFEIIKTHTIIGAKILANSRAEIIQVAQQIALSHHEKWNGNGFPQGLAASDIPITARIVGIVDVFDALISRRPYKEPYPVDVALEIIEEGRAERFDPELVDVLVDNIDEILQIEREIGR